MISCSSLPSSMSMYQDIDLPPVTARSKQCLKPSDTGRATDPVVRRPS
jgi:hypothetical protein